MSVMQAKMLENANNHQEFMSALMSWEQLILKYEQASSATLADDVKRAVLLRNLPEASKQQVWFNADRLET